MNVPIALLLGFGLGVLAAVCAAAGLSWWADFAAAREAEEPESINGDVPFLGHALAMWSAIHGPSGRNDAPASPSSERNVIHG